jgi:ABC-type microcin C transport system permease subunit YejB
MGLILGLLVLWVVLVVIGFAVKALLWLAIVGLVLFAATSVFAAFGGRRRRGVLR